MRGESNIYLYHYQDKEIGDMRLLLKQKFFNLSIPCLLQTVLAFSCFSMKDKNPSLYPKNHIHAMQQPFMHDLLFQHCTLKSYVLNNDTTFQNHTSLKETPESIVPP
ncbi:hypothetical protein TanjilG_20774 [Lupinus angustifolius]|uniref:Uncharacterized protein n=1 Tax=Lupinus angustifolius TaxID=3871 RepID=A0A4P1QRP0_LUPAN|nr:hypothetical protein TanjilG_20774 [Lupinus angustifolius]